MSNTGSEHKQVKRRIELCVKTPFGRTIVCEICFVFVEMSFVCRVSFFYCSLDLRWSLKWLNLDIASVSSVLVQLFFLANKTRRKKRHERDNDWFFVASHLANSTACTVVPMVQLLSVHMVLFEFLLLAVLLVRPIACMCLCV